MGCKSAPILDMVTKLHVADPAILIRKQIIRADNQFTDNVVTLVHSPDDVGQLVATGFLDVPDNNCVQSSWLGFELYGVEWGSLLGKFQSVRSPDVGVINRASVVLPQLPNGGMEVLVGLESSYLDKLLSDPLLNKLGVPW
jgi:hypothetical protein